MLTLFPSAIMHETSPHADDSERITLAFDTFLQDFDLGGCPGGAGMHIVMDDPVVFAGNPNEGDANARGNPVLARND